MLNSKIIKVILCIGLIGINNAISAMPPTMQKLNYGTIPVVILTGSNTQMGISYGQTFQSALEAELKIIENYYITQKSLTYNQLVAQSALFYNRIPYNYQLFLQGIAQGSKLQLSDIEILNAMETLGELLPGHAEPKCAFIFVPPSKTVHGKALIGRNYDYPAPFDQLSKYVSVVILKAPDTVPTAMIAITGEIYCPSCVNANGLFMELNNGTPSGGTTVNIDRQSLLSNMLITLQNSITLSDIEKKMNATESDFSLIVNAADAAQTQSFEFSSILGLKFLQPTTQTFVSTNFYLDPAWNNTIPIPTDTATWYGVTRRNNLLNLSAQAPQYDITAFEKTMDTSMANGGAVWALTIYQLIFDESDMTLYVKINNQGDGWNNIPLADLFATSSK